MLFVKEKEVIWGLIASLLIANFALLAMNVPMIKVFIKILEVPPEALMPTVTMI
ncbi:MAG: putative tricarboxylic transport membrane protein [Octadecabacter sp.]|jgi:putative tricarboxylic transport membrane protein